MLTPQLAVPIHLSPADGRIDLKASVLQHSVFELNVQVDVLAFLISIQDTQATVVVFIVQGARAVDVALLDRLDFQLHFVDVQVIANLHLAFALPFARNRTASDGCQHRQSMNDSHESSSDVQPNILTAEARTPPPLCSRRRCGRATIGGEGVLSQEHRYKVGMYQRVSAVGATPFDRLATMYTGALRLAQQGLKAANAGRPADAKVKSERLAAVIRRLDMCLDFRLAPELCRNLSRLYSHLQHRLSDPVTGHSADAFSESLKILETLWDGFQTAEHQSQR